MGFWKSDQPPAPDPPAADEPVAPDTNDDDDDEVDDGDQMHDMTLRDEFAQTAMEKLLEVGWSGGSQPRFEEIAKLAYACADAMITEKRKGEGS
jgi:hypothetical protein